MDTLPRCMLHSMDGVSLLINHFIFPRTSYLALVEVDLSHMAVTSKTILVQVLQERTSRVSSISFLLSHVLTSSLITSGSILWGAFFFILPCRRQSSASQRSTPPPLTLTTLPSSWLVTQGLHLPHGFTGFSISSSQYRLILTRSACRTRRPHSCTHASCCGVVLQPSPSRKPTVRCCALEIDTTTSSLPAW